MAVVALLLGGCAGTSSVADTSLPSTTGGTGDTAADLSFTVSPTLRPNPGAGLTAWLDASTSAPASLALEVTVGERGWTVEDPSAVDHEVLVLGLRADADVTVDVVATDALGRTARATATLHTDPLPTTLHPPTIVVSDPARMEPGVTELADSQGWIMLVDADGQPCWYVPYPGAVREVGLWPGPHLGVVAARSHIDELDLSGAVLRTWGNERDPDPHVPVDVFANHHDVRMLPDGHLLTLGIERRWMLHPTSESDPNAPWAEVWVAGDIPMELDPDTGAILRQWPLLDRLDPGRIGYDSVTGDFWEDIGDWNGDDVHDWAHANSVSYDPATDTVLVSLRHQDAVVGLSRSTGAVEWILGSPAQWNEPWRDLLLSPDPKPADFRWNWHQHGAQFTPSGTILMFDNGNYGVPAYFPKLPGRLSRALEVRVHPETHTFEVVWSWGEELGLFSPSLGEADALPQTDHVLVDFGNSEDPDGPAVLVEVARDGTVVWRAESAPGQTWFRSGRWTGVIPGPGR